MHPEAKASIVRKLTAIVALINYPAVQGQRLTKFFNRSGGPVYTLTDCGVEEYNEVLRELLVKSNWQEKFSEKHVGNRLLDILAAAKLSPETTAIGGDFDKLVAEFESYSQEQIVYLPLAGIRMDMSELQLGSVTLQNFTDSRTDRLIDRYRSILWKAHGTDSAKEAIYAHVKEQVFSQIRHRVCAEYRAVAEPEKAQELALEETRRAIDLLRFSIPALDPSNLRISIGLQGEQSEEGRASVTLAGDDTTADPASEIVYHPCHVTSQTVDKMQEIGVFELSSLIQKVKLTEFEDVLLRAVHWFANAQAQLEKENLLLNLVTCLETLFTPKNKDPITAAVSEGVALLLGTTFEERRHLVKTVRKVYELRSSLSHHGQGKILKNDLLWLRIIAMQVIMQLIQRKDEFTTQQDLFDWIERKKLGG